ncbi:MAG: hypothetical protein HY904_23160 [Deltaproteobacteria bacterium]|nr:hypothetical protein [Deltaproteobacteria bacterium]
MAVSDAPMHPPGTATSSSATLALERFLRQAGADCRTQGDCVSFHLPLHGAELRSLLTQQPLLAASGYSVMGTLLKFHDPPELAYLALLDPVGCTTHDDLVARLRGQLEGLRVRLATHHDLLTHAGLRPAPLDGRPVLAGRGTLPGCAFDVLVEPGPRLVLAALGPPGGVRTLAPSQRVAFNFPPDPAEHPAALLDQVRALLAARPGLLLPPPAAAPTPPPPPPPPPTPPQRTRTPAPGATFTSLMGPLPVTLPPPSTPPPAEQTASDLDEPTPITDMPPEPTPPPEDHRTPVARVGLPASDLAGPTDPGADPTAPSPRRPRKEKVAEPGAMTVLVLGNDVRGLRRAFRALDDPGIAWAVVALDGDTPALVRMARPQVLVLEDAARDLDEVRIGELAAETHAHGGVVLSYVDKGDRPRLPVLHHVMAPLTTARLRRVVKSARRSGGEATHS